MESRIHREVYVRFGRGYRRDRPRKRVWRGGAYLMRLMVLTAIRWTLFLKM